MARIRTIKPDFFTSEDIGELTVNSRLLYIALWTQADKEGKLKFNKVYLKAVTMPYEPNLFMSCIEELERNKHIVIYEIDGKKFLKLPTFIKHQKCHHTEAESALPDPDFEPKKEDNCCLTVKEPLDNRKEKEKEKEQEKEETHPPTPHEGDVCFFENSQEEDNAQPQEAIGMLLDNFIDLKTLLGENIKNAGGYKARIATAIRNGETTICELKKQIKKMQDEIAAKAKKRIDLERIDLQFEQRNKLNVSDEEIMKMFYKMASDERTRIEEEAKKLAIEANPSFDTFPPSLKKMTQKSYIIHICLPLFNGIAQCVN